MLTGAARAARTCGAFRPERVWVVAVPVVTVLVLERVYHLLSVWFVTPFLFIQDPWSLLVGRGGPWCLRTAIVSICLAAGCYLFVQLVLCAAEYLREVRRQGRRVLLRGGSTGHLFVVACLFLLLVLAFLPVVTLPTAEDIIEDVRVQLRTGSSWRLHSAVRNDVPGIRSLCRKNLDHPARGSRLLAAMSLKMLGEGCDETRRLLRSITREEFLDPANDRLVYDLRWLSRGSTYELHFVPTDPEKRWEQFRREHIP